VEEIFVGNLGFYASNLEFCATFPRFHRKIQYRKTVAYFSTLRPQFVFYLNNRSTDLNNPSTDRGDTMAVVACERDLTEF